MSVPLQHHEIVSRQNPHDRTFCIDLEGGRTFQITISIVEKHPTGRFMGNYHVRKPTAVELLQGLTRIAAMPVKTPAHPG